MVGELPPDLVVEVDIASRSESKLKIYEAMGVPEIWIYRHERLVIKQLQAGQYIDTVMSRVFPLVGVDQLNEWLQRRQTGTDLTVVRAVRLFCRQC